MTLCRSILRANAHRPWPLPARAWAMFMTWHDLLFMHWPVRPDVLRPLIPSGLALDTFEGEAFIGVVPFGMANVGPRFAPAAPWLSRFPELNVRTYVTVNGKPGVYFFSLDAASRLAVRGARRFFHLPYFDARMGMTVKADTVQYASARTHQGAPPAEFAGVYRPTGPVDRSASGQLEHWLTERYALYSASPGGRIFRGDIHHSPWPLQRAEAEVSVNTMTAQINVALPDTRPLLHFAKRLDVLAWRLTPAGA